MCLKTSLTFWVFLDTYSSYIMPALVYGYACAPLDTEQIIIKQKIHATINTVKYGNT